MRFLLPAILVLLAACESAPQYRVAGEDTQVEVQEREWVVTQYTVEPLTFRAYRLQGEFFLFGPPPRTKTSQAISALQKATGCRVIRGSLYRNISDQFYSQMDCSRNPSIVNGKQVYDGTPLL